MMETCIEQIAKSSTIHEVEIDYSKKVETLEENLLKLPQVDCPVTHKFGAGVYMREVFLPKGAIVIGHHQNFEHMNIFVKGKITFSTEKGPVELTAPLSFVSKPGRKIAYIHEDSIWVNIYPTNETNVEKLEEKYLTKSETFLRDLDEKEKILLLTSKVNNDDFELFLSECGFNKEMVKKISVNEEDMTGLPNGSYKIKTGKSPIDGTGLFATSNIFVNEPIAPARIGLKRTIAGRYANHSVNPNAKMVDGLNGNIYLVATKKITGCRGGQDGEEITVDYREAMKVNLKIGEKLCQE